MRFESCSRLNLKHLAEMLMKSSPEHFSLQLCYPFSLSDCSLVEENKQSLMPVHLLSPLIHPDSLVHLPIYLCRLHSHSLVLPPAAVLILFLATYCYTYINTCFSIQSLHLYLEENDSWSRLLITEKGNHRPWPYHLKWRWRLLHWCGRQHQRYRHAAWSRSCYFENHEDWHMGETYPTTT